jgi:hypothetical protein
VWFLFPLWPAHLSPEFAGLGEIVMMANNDIRAVYTKKLLDFVGRANGVQPAPAQRWLGLVDAPIARAVRVIAETVFPLAAGTQRRFRCFAYCRRKHSKAVQDNNQHEVNHIEQQVNDERQKHKLQRYAPYEIPSY